MGRKNPNPQTTTASPSPARQWSARSSTTPWPIFKAWPNCVGATWSGREETVVAASNLPALEALALNVIDLMANDIDELLNQLHGRSTSIGGQTVVLDLEDAEVSLIEPDWRHEFLALITDPNVAYILLMIGIYGLILEFYNPGMGLPGIVGVICLLLGAFALQMLPINYAGLALIAVGIGLMVAEALSPSFGVFGIGGVVAFVLGSIMLMDTDVEGLPDFAGYHRRIRPRLRCRLLLCAGSCVELASTKSDNRHRRDAWQYRHSQRGFR